MLRETKLADCAVRVEERDGASKGEGCGYEEWWDVEQAEGRHFRNTMQSSLGRFLWLQLEE